MYAWLFRHLPGPLWMRIVITIVAIAALVVVLFGWVFPAIAPYMPFNDGLVGALGPEAPNGPEASNGSAALSSPVAPSSPVASTFGLLRLV